MGTIDYRVEPSVDLPPVRRDAMDAVEGLAGADGDDPLSAARGVAWALVFGAAMWGGLYLLWRTVFG